MQSLPRLLKVLLISTSFLPVALLSVRSHAQYGVLNSPNIGTGPNQPKLSPYLDLLRNDDSVLSPYHSFVLPRRAISQQQSVQAGQLRRLEYETSARRAAQGTSSVRRLSTGRGGQFQTTLHFFPSVSSN